jgi:hypothetical protein
MAKDWAISRQVVTIRLIMAIRWDARHWGLFMMATLAAASATLLAFGVVCTNR